MNKWCCCIIAHRPSYVEWIPYIIEPPPVEPPIEPPPVEPTIPHRFVSYTTWPIDKKLFVSYDIG